jgi:8-oxo-dGTP pyrophosphatase MutT (NUDIX family)
MSTTYNFCNNCGKNGHAFHQCRYPITSIGIIAFRNTKEGIKYLMIRRKDTLGFVDFMRGKYPLFNQNYLRNIINEMTIQEKHKLLNNSFNELWKDLWGENIGIQYRIEENTSRNKFDLLKIGITKGSKVFSLSSLIKDSTTSWKETEWGFAKGRRNYQEKDINCALREFQEETGYSKNSIDIIQNLIPFEETFTGSNYKSYKHCYYVAHIDNNIKPLTDFQISEVSKLEWFTFTQALDMIRPYNQEKMSVLSRIDELLNKFRLYT